MADNNTNNNNNQKKPMVRTTSAFESIQGRRWNMEDTHVVFDDLSKISAAAGKLKDNKYYAFYAVYDGHGGKECADKCERHVHEIILGEPAFLEENYESAMKEGYMKADKKIMELLTKEETKCGSTAVSILLVEDTLYIANLGDSEAVLAKRKPPSEISSESSESQTSPPTPIYTAELLTAKHKPSDPSEKERVEKNGGHVIFGRVLGSLAVSRAFGDLEFKFPYNKAEGDFVSAHPFTRKIKITEENPFMIIACDGLWDKLEYDEAINYVAEQRRAGKSIKEAVDALVKHSYEKGSMDNITAILVEFSWQN